MNKMLHIALNTFRESVRDRVLYVIGFFAMLMLAGSKAVGWVSVGEELQVVQDFSLAVVSFFGALIAVFVGTGLIYKEIDKRTLYIVLSKPVERWQFVIGKFLGLLAVTGCVILGMGLLSMGFVALVAGEGAAAVHWEMYAAALAMTFFEMMIVTALAIFFSTVASPILAAIFTFCGYLIGQVTPSLMDLIRFQPPKESVAKVTQEHLTDFVAMTHWVLKPLSEAFYWMLPDLTHFHLRNRVVMGPPLQDGEFLYSVVYALGYSVALVLIAAFFFSRRKF